MIVFKVSFRGIIISVISVYAPQCDLDDNQKQNFYDSFINVTKLGETKIIVIAGDFNGHVGSNIENYEDQHGGYGYGVRNKDGERILEFCTAMNKTTVGNTLISRKANNLATYESGPSKTEVDYCLVKRNRRKFWKGVKVLPSEEFITQHEP